MFLHPLLKVLMSLLEAFWQCSIFIMFKKILWVLFPAILVAPNYLAMNEINDDFPSDDDLQENEASCNQTDAFDGKTVQAPNPNESTLKVLEKGVFNVNFSTRESLPTGGRELDRMHTGQIRRGIAKHLRCVSVSCDEESKNLGKSEELDEQYSQETSDTVPSSK